MEAATSHVGSIGDARPTSSSLAGILDLDQLGSPSAGSPDAYGTQTRRRDCGPWSALAAGLMIGRDRTTHSAHSPLPARGAYRSARDLHRRSGARSTSNAPESLAWIRASGARFAGVPIPAAPDRILESRREPSTPGRVRDPGTAGRCARDRCSTARARSSRARTAGSAAQALLRAAASALRICRSACPARPSPPDEGKRYED